MKKHFCDIKPGLVFGHDAGVNGDPHHWIGIVVEMYPDEKRDKVKVFYSHNQSFVNNQIESILFFINNYGYIVTENNNDKEV